MEKNHQHLGFVPKCWEIGPFLPLKTLRAILLGQKTNEPPKRHLGPHMDRKRMERLLMGSEIPRPTTRNGAKT